MQQLQISTWYQGYDSMMCYQVTIELRSREYYQAIPLEAISEEDWLHTDVDRDNNVWLVKWRHWLTSKRIHDVSKFEQNCVWFKYVWLSLRLGSW